MFQLNDACIASSDSASAGLRGAPDRNRTCDTRFRRRLWRAGEYTLDLDIQVIRGPGESRSLHVFCTTGTVAYSADVILAEATTAEHGVSLDLGSLPHTGAEVIDCNTAIP